MLDFLSSQIDYILYCQALGLFLLGAILYGFSRVAYKNLKWKWVLLFIFLEVIFFVMTILGLSLDPNPTYEILTLLLIPCAYLCLLQFSRSLCLEFCKKNIPVWFFPVLALATIPFLFKGAESFYFSVNYLLRVPAFLFLALICYVTFRKGHEKRKLLLILIPSFVGFSLCLLFYPPYLPRHSTNVFTNLFSVLILILLALKFEFERSEIVGSDLRLKREGFFRHHVIGTVVLIGFLGAFITYGIGEYKTTKLKESFLSQAKTLSQLIDLKDLGSEGNKSFDQLAVALQSLSYESRFFLALKDKDGKPYVSYLSKKEKGAFENSSELSPLLSHVFPVLFSDGQATLVESIDEANLPRLSALIPLVAVKGESPVAVLGIDRSVEEFKQGVFRFRLISLFALSFIVGPLISVWVLRRKDQEDELQRIERTTKMFARQRILFEISNLKKVSLFDFFVSVNEKLAPILPVDRLSIWIFSSDGKNLICRDLFIKATGEHKALEEILVDLYPKHFRFLVNQRSFISTNVQKDERLSEIYEPFLKPYSVKSLMTIPLRGHGRLLGVMSYEQTQHPQGWDIEEREFCCSVADIIALAVDNYELEKLKNEKKVLEGQIIQSSKLMAVGTLASGLAHEINNPLSVIRGYLESNQEKFRKVDDLPRVWERMMQAVWRIEKVVRGLRLYSQSTDESIKECSLQDVINHSLTLLNPLLTQDHITLKWDDQVGPVRVQGNPGRLQEVLVNLFTNARDAVAEMESHHRTISLVSRLENKRYKLDIFDTGAGIKSSILPRVFDPFFTTKAPGKGTGLGLYSAHSIITLYGGHISIESLEGKGTVVHLDLPLAKGNEVIDRSEVSSEIKLEDEFLKILVVDDEPDVREIVSEYLERKGMHVTLAKDGQEGLEFIQNHHYDVVVTDIKMPRMRGDKLIEEAKKIPNLRSKFIVMTGGVEWDEEKRAVELADHQLRKPFEFKHFFKVIQQVSRS